MVPKPHLVGNRRGVIKGHQQPKERKWPNREWQVAKYRNKKKRRLLMEDAKLLVSAEKKIEAHSEY